MANQDRVNFVWAESALTTIPPIPVSEVAYRDTTQTPEQMEVGQQYDTIYNSARHNQLLFLLTSVAKTLCENGIMPFLAGQEYSQYARCIFTDGKLYVASRAILADEQPYPTPGDDSGVWKAGGTNDNLVPDSRRVIAGTGLTGGGPLSSDVTLSAKLDGKTTQADAGGVITVKDVAIGGDLGDLASARGQIGDNIRINTASDLNAYTKAGNWLFSDAAAGENFPNIGRGGELNCYVSTTAIFQFFTEFNNNRRYIRYGIPNSTWTNWIQFISVAQLGDGIRNTNGIISVPEYEGATVSTAGTSGLVPPAAAGQQESFLTGGGEYKPALSTGGGIVTGSIQINDPANVIGSAPSANTKRGLFLGDKNSVIMGGFDVIQRASDNAKYTQMFAKNASGAVASIAAVMYEDGTREISTDCPMRLSDVQIERIFDNDVRLIKISGARGNEGLAMCYSPDSGELYLDGRAVHGKADTAVYATSAGTLYINEWPATWHWNGQEGQPEWLWGGNEATRSSMYVYNPANFSVNYANSAGSAATANTATGLTYTFTTNSFLVLPPGGTWFVLKWWDGDSGSAMGNWSGGQIAAGGSRVDVRNGAFALRVA
jgi:hypothetical protein